MNKKFQLEYGKKEIYAVKWSDHNCDRKGKCFVTEDRRDIIQLFNEHESHEGLTIHVQAIKAEWIFDGRVVV